MAIQLPIKAPNGKTYETLAELVKDYNVNYQTLYYRLDHGTSIEDALNTALKGDHSIKGPDGKTYRSVAELAKICGLSASTIYRRMKRNVSEDELIGEVPKKPKSAKSIKGPDGKIYESIKDLAEAYDISYPTLGNRLRRGIPVERALDKSKARKARNKSTKTTPTGHGKIIAKGLNGETYDSLSDMAKAYNVNKATFYNKFRRGLSLEEILVTKTYNLVSVDDQMGNRFPTAAARANYYMIKGKNLQRGMTPSIKNVCDALKRKPNCDAVINGRTFKITDAKAPYLEVEAGNERFMIHLDKMLEMYHNSTEFDPLSGLRRLKPRIQEIKPVRFPYYDVMLDGVSKKMSYWDLMQEESRIQNELKAQRGG